MTPPRFLLGTSFYAPGRHGSAFRHEFVHLWHKCVAAWDHQPTRTVVLALADSERPAYPNTDVVKLSGNCGHAEDLFEGRKTNEYCGWSATMCALAMVAYSDESDFLYCEEDCLTWGPVVSRMYADMGDGVMVFGAKHKSPPYMPCSQSLFLVRNKFIPTFVASYLALGGERNKTNLGEHKFCRIADKFGHMQCRRLSFGVDRERPIPWESPVGYVQQLSPEELEIAKTKIFKT